jgi:hypothetical protein
MILLISASQVAGISGVSHCALMFNSKTEERWSQVGQQLNQALKYIQDPGLKILSRWLLILISAPHFIVQAAAALSVTSSHEQEKRQG